MSFGSTIVGWGDESPPAEVDRDAVCDGDDNGDCDEGHACVAGLCQHLPEQTELDGAQCDDDDADCAEGHSCVGGYCVR